MITNMAIELNSSTSTLSAPENKKVEIEVLRAQLSTMQFYQENFIDIVLWSLGTVAALTLALLAYNWYSHKNSLERDKDALKQERENLKRELTSLITGSTLTIKNEVLQQVSELEDPLVKRIEKLLESKISSLQNRMNEIRSSVTEIEYKFLEKEAEDAFSNKKYGWAIYKYCELLDICKTKQFGHYEIPNLIDRLQSIVTVPNVKLDADDIIKISSSLKALPSQYQIAADRVLAHLR